jgi:hypothetical protein
VFTCIVIMLVGLTGCSGTMKGVVRDGGNRAKFTYENTKFGSGELYTKLPDGERFKGQFIEESSDGPEFELDSTAKKKTTASRSSEAMDSFEGKVMAVLYGDKGHTMMCKFKPTDPLIGVPGGGIGLCLTSDGRLIDLYY